MPLSDMLYSDDLDGTPHPATDRPLVNDRKSRRVQLSGEFFGEDPAKGFDEPEPPETHDYGPDN